MLTWDSMNELSETSVSILLDSPILSLDPFLHFWRIKKAWFWLGKTDFRWREKLSKLDEANS